jgi:hypothetical protein
VEREHPERGEQHPGTDLAIEAACSRAQRETGISMPITNQIAEPARDFSPPRVSIASFASRGAQMGGSAMAPPPPRVRRQVEGAQPVAACNAKGFPKLICDAGSLF